MASQSDSQWRCDCGCAWWAHRVWRRLGLFLWFKLPSRYIRLSGTTEATTITQGRTTTTRRPPQKQQRKQQGSTRPISLYAFFPPPLTGEYDWLIMRFLADNFEHHEHGSQWEGAELEAVDEHWLHNQCERHIQITGSADLSAHDLSASILRILSDRSSG